MRIVRALAVAIAVAIGANAIMAGPAVALPPNWSNPEVASTPVNTAKVFNQYSIYSCANTAAPLSVTTAPAHGSISFVPATVSGCAVTMVKYTPNSDYTGSDSFVVDWGYSSPPPAPDTMNFTITYNITVGSSSQSTSAVVTPQILRQTTQQVGGLIARRISQITSPPVPAQWRGHRVPTSNDHSALPFPRQGGGEQLPTPSLLGLQQENDFPIGVGRDTRGDIFGRDFSLDAPNLLGAAAGDGPGGANGPIGVWGNATYTAMRNSFSSTKSDGYLLTLLGGGDIRPTERWLVGSAVTLEFVEMDTTFNDGTLSSAGWSVSPYAAYILSDETDARLVLDGLVSYGNQKADTTRDRSTQQVSGSYSGFRTMAAMNLTYTKLLEAWSLSGKVGYLWAHQRNGAMEESDATQVDGNTTRLGQAKAGARAAYAFTDFEPYVGATYLYDVMTTSTQAGNGQASPGTDRSEVETVAGVTWLVGEQTTLGAELAHGFFRDNLSATSLSLQFRTEF
jgi:hypothetical protein